MKIQYLSDLHLEFKENSEYLKKYPIEVSGDILLMAGDTAYLNTPEYENHFFWDWASRNYQEVVVCIGNHELYQYYDISSLKDGLIGEIRHNVHFYYNSVVRFPGLDVLVSTLWGHINPVDFYATEHGVSDFYRIRNGKYRLTADAFNAENEKCITFIKNAIKESTARNKIVLTHHLPTYSVVAKEFQGSQINGAFVCELGEYIADADIDYWIYGHSHRNLDLVIGKTKIISNQLGYVCNNEHICNNFSRSKHIEI